MATIIDMSDFWKSANDTLDSLTPEEADLIEQELLRKYPHIQLTETESANMYANIMHRILRMENTSKGRDKDE